MKGDLERERDRDRRRLRYGERERDLDRLLERDPLEGELYVENTNTPYSDI